MTRHEFLSRLERMDLLIQRRATGPARDFTARLGVATSLLPTMRTLILLLSLIGLLGLSLPAQSLQVDLSASGGGNWAWGGSPEGFRQSPYATFSLQAGLGVALSPHWGVGAGLAYFEPGIRTQFSFSQLEGPGDLSVVVVNSYLSPRIYAWHSFAGRPGWLKRTQAQVGLRYGRDQEGFRLTGNPEAQLPNGEFVEGAYLTEAAPHHLWAIEASWTYDLLQHEGHKLLVGLHLMKGLTPIMTTTQSYTVTPSGDTQSSRLTLQGDFLGLTVGYRWRQLKSGTKN